MESISKSIFIKSKYLLGLLLVGALGSGLWDVFLKDLIFYLGGVFVKIMSYLYSGYVDYLYSNVGKLYTPLEIIPAVIFIIFIIFSPGFGLLLGNTFYHRLKQPDPDKYYNKTSKAISIFNFLTKSKRRIYSIILIITIPISISYTNLLIKEITIIKAVNYIDQTIEIIRPYITESDFISLRSEFRQINNKEKFDKIIFKIKAYASKGGVKLPESVFY